MKIEKCYPICIRIQGKDSELIKTATAVRHKAYSASKKMCLDVEMLEKDGVLLMFVFGDSNERTIFECVSGKEGVLFPVAVKIAGLQDERGKLIDAIKELRKHAIETAGYKTAYGGQSKESHGNILLFLFETEEGMFQMEKFIETLEESDRRRS